MVLPGLAVVITLFIAYFNEYCGINIYGSCSLKQANNVFFVLIMGTLMVLSVMTLWNLHQFKKQSEYNIHQVDTFCDFYYKYIILIFIVYVIVGLGYLIGHFINKCMENNPNHKNKCF